MLLRLAGLLLMLLWPARLLRAQDAPPASGQAVETEETGLARRVADALRKDAGLRRALARRLLQSSLRERLAQAEDPQAAADAIDGWIFQHPEDAAQLKIGFAKDDFDGTHAFEQSLYRRVERYFELNPKRYQGILGTLEAAGSESKFLMGQGRKLAEERQRELLKRIFEGQGSEGRRILNSPQDSQARNPASGQSGYPIFAGSGIYDRLSALQPAGYSPEVLALQNALNARRIPGTPRIPETGKLDFATLAAPYYPLRRDLDRLESSFQADQTKTARQGPAPGTGPSAAAAPLKRRVRRRKALDRAESALEAFQNEVEEAREPSWISSALLRALGRRQKEMARWITVASLEDDLERLESLPSGWPDELLENIRTAPVEEDARRRYLQEGRRLLDRLARVKDADERTIEALESREFLDRWTDAQSLTAQAAPLRDHLSQNIAMYARVPYMLAQAARPKSAWRAFLDWCLVRIAPSASYARRVLEENRRLEALQAAFGRIAGGDFAGAAALLQ